MAVLPKPSELKKKPKPTAVDHSKSRLAALSKEENATVRRINDLKDEEERLKRKMERKEEKIDDIEKNVLQALRSEVEALERRKQEALKPVDERADELQAFSEELDKQAAVLLSERESVNADRRKLDKDREAVKSLEDMAKKHLANAERLQKDLEGDTQEMRRKARDFDEEKKNYAKDVLTREMKLKARENDVTRQEETFRIREALLQTRGKEIHDKRREVDSGYAALIEARKHVKKKKK